MFIGTVGIFGTKMFMCGPIICQLGKDEEEKQMRS